LFLLPAETAHRATLALLRLLYAVPGLPALVRWIYARHVPKLPLKLLGLTFQNPVGLAAGLDKNAKCLRAFADLGFGFVEVGTVTPRPQPGNPPPRLFRLKPRAAIINRMGFNNVGLTEFAENVRAQGKPCVVGINLGKNKDTPMENALDDYRSGLRVVYELADYVTINVSSPNTANLRDLQQSENLKALLAGLKAEQVKLAAAHHRAVPLAVKIAPDLSDEEIRAIAKLLRDEKIDAVIATNTTLARDNVEGLAYANEAGGLSGRPLKERATHVIAVLYQELQGDIPIIGVGGIENAADAWDKLVAGAELIQLYTGFVYAGPGLIAEIVHGLQERARFYGTNDWREAVLAARKR
jgi:dihydroorotate dehydrogenase